jgi:arylsulfatase A-like enzyme
MLGEKQHWRKFALWEESARAPYMWIVPGVTKPGGVCNRTVDYMQIYPTLCDLAGLPAPKQGEGESIRKLLANPDAPWDKPAITTWLYNNHTVRTERWRYIRYDDGSEELYDHERDPLEWTNLAQNPEYASVKAGLIKWVPTENKPWPERVAKDPARKNRKASKKE